MKYVLKFRKELNVNRAKITKARCMNILSIVIISSLMLVSLGYFTILGTANSNMNRSHTRSDSNYEIIPITNFSDSGMGAVEPDISGNMIVWADTRSSPDGTGEGLNIYGYDLNAKRELSVCTAQGDQRYPIIDGDKIVWEDLRNTQGGNNYDVYMYDLSTNAETAICTENSAQCWANIQGEKITWHTYEDNNNQVYLYDLSTETQTQLVPSRAAHEMPSIYGDKVVWVDTTNDKYGDIYLYNLSVDTDNDGIPNYLDDDLDGDGIPNRFDSTAGTGGSQVPGIINRNQSSGSNDPALIPITNGDGFYQGYPAIYGDKIIWVDSRNDPNPNDNVLANTDIYMYDLARNSEVQITTSPLNQSYPDIDGNLVVYESETNVNGNTEWWIHTYNILTGEDTAITKMEFEIDGNDGNLDVLDIKLLNFRPRISDRKIVWCDERVGSGVYNIYMMGLGPEQADPTEPTRVLTASFTYTPQAPTVDDTVQFTDTSTDLGGTITAWNWNFGDGATSNSQNPTHKYTITNTYTVTLRVTDNSGATNTATQMLTVTGGGNNPQNNPPTVTISSPADGQTVSGVTDIRGTASDTDGTVNKVEVKIDNTNWQQATGTNSWSYKWDTTSAAEGTHTISARSFDGTEYSTVVSITILVNNSVDNSVDGNHPPSVRCITANPITLKPGEFSKISTDAYDEDSDALIYQYTTTGGTISGDGPTITWTAPNIEGTYMITVTVNDGQLNSNSKSVSVTVSSETTPTTVNHKPKIISADAVPLNVPNDGTTSVLFTVEVQDDDGKEDISSVIIDLSAIGGKKEQNLYDNGRFGDEKAGDGIYSYETTIDSTIPKGSKTLAVTVQDSAENIVTEDISVEVTKAPTTNSAKETKTSSIPGFEVILITFSILFCLVLRLLAKRNKNLKN